MVLLLLVQCWLLLPVWDSVIVLCFVVRYFMSILVLQESWWERGSWLLYFVCLAVVSWLLLGSYSWWQGFVCSLWMWYFLITRTYYFGKVFTNYNIYYMIHTCNGKLRMCPIVASHSRLTGVFSLTWSLIPMKRDKYNNLLQEGVSLDQLPSSWQ